MIEIAFQVAQGKIIDLIVIHAMLMRIDLLETLFDFADVLSHLLDLLQSELLLVR